MCRFGTGPGSRLASPTGSRYAVSRRDDGSLVASIVDPHGDHLADAKFKLRALADYADTYSGEFLRIESVATRPPV
jgi:hypothetical protein